MRRRFWRLYFTLLGIVVHIFIYDILLGRWFGGSTIRRWVRLARRFRRLAIDLGGVPIKLGQFLSVRVDVLPAPVTAILAGNSGTCTISTTAGVTCFGDLAGIRGANPPPNYGPIVMLAPGANPPVAFGASMLRGALHVILQNGSVVGWGNNSNDCLVGTGSTAYVVYAPEPLEGLSCVTTISTGVYNSCATTSSGSLFCWGSDDPDSVGVLGVHEPLKHTFCGGGVVLAINYPLQMNF